MRALAARRKWQFFPKIIYIKSHALIMPRLTKFVIILYLIYFFLRTLLFLFRFVLCKFIDVMISGLYSRMHFQWLPLNYLYVEIKALWAGEHARAHAQNSISLSIFLVCLPQYCCAMIIMITLSIFNKYLSWWLLLLLVRLLLLLLLLHTYAV